MVFGTYRFPITNVILSADDSISWIIILNYLKISKMTLEYKKNEKLTVIVGKALSTMLRNRKKPQKS